MKGQSGRAEEELYVTGRQCLNIAFAKEKENKKKTNAATQPCFVEAARAGTFKCILKAGQPQHVNQTPKLW